MRAASPGLVGGGPARTRTPRPPKAKTYQYRKFRGVNLTDARVAIDDDEFAWLENAMTIGNGAIQILNAVGASVATIAAGIASLWGFTLSGNPVMITINTDGSISQVMPGGVVTAVAGAGSVTTACVVSIWQASPILFLDPTKGYAKWDGTTYTVIDATKTGQALAVFEGRAWLAKNRTITYTAPTTFDDFVAGDGSGSVVISDDAFQGNIVELASALEQLWIIGQSAIEALANVQATGVAPNVVTTFSITNVVTNLGTNAPFSVIGYFRALAFLAPFGVHALSGVTPQKLSDKLDGLIPDVTITSTTVSSAVAIVQNLLCLLIRVTYTGTKAQAGAGPLALLLGFTQGKWFFAVQGTATIWITSLISAAGVPQAWGTDGSTIYQLFGAASTAAVTHKVQSKLYDFGLATTAKALTKMGLEYQAANAITPTLTVDSEYTSTTVAITQGTTLTLLNSSGATLQLQNSVLAHLSLVTQGFVLSRNDAPLTGRYLGWTIAGTTAPYRIQAVQMEVTPTREWSVP